MVLTMDIQLCVKMILPFGRVCVGSDWCLGCHMRQNISELRNKGGKLRIPLTYTDFPSQRTFEVCSFVPIVYNEPTSAQGSSVDDSVPLSSDTTPENHRALRYNWNGSNTRHPFIKSGLRGQRYALSRYGPRFGSSYCSGCTIEKASRGFPVGGVF